MKDGRERIVIVRELISTLAQLSLLLSEVTRGRKHKLFSDFIDQKNDERL